MLSKLNQSNLVQTLIHWGADINEKDADGRTPLELAQAASNPWAVDVLSKNGAKVDKLKSLFLVPKSSIDARSVILKSQLSVAATNIDPYHSTP